MQKVIKNVNLLYIICGDYLLMRKFSHQDYEVIDTFSFKNESEENIEVSINSKLTSLFGKTFAYNFFGTIESVINKKDINNEDIAVHIDIKTYKVLLDEKYHVLDSYTDDVVKNTNQVLWLHKDEIQQEARLREGDRKTLKKIFDEKNIDITMVEDQGERWIDAKTVMWEDK